jgi:ABC-2 type transport system permease protein
VFARIDTKRLFRDKVAIFFVFIFPLIFLLIFGFIFQDNNVSFRVTILSQSDTPFAKEFVKRMESNDLFKIDTEVSNQEQANEKMYRNQLDATLVLTAEFGAVRQGAQFPSGEVIVIYDKSNQTAGTTLVSVMNDVFKEIN